MWLSGNAEMLFVSLCLLFYGGLLSYLMICNFYMLTGRGVLQFTVLTGAAMINLIIYTLWAAMRQYQVTTYCPFLINHVLMFLFYLIIQVLFPFIMFSTVPYLPDAFLSHLVYLGPARPTVPWEAST